MRTLAAATLGFVLLGFVVAGPALLGKAAVGPATALDRDPLYRLVANPPKAPVGDATPIALDFPRDLTFARNLHAGRLALWNPLVGSGAPLSAEWGPFFPLKLPFYLAPSPRTYAAFLMLRLVAAGLGAYLLARTRGLAPLPAFAAGATFELSGPMIAQFPFGCYSPTCVLPWAVLGAQLIASRRTATASVAAALALGAAGNAGHPTLSFMVFAGFGAATAGHLIAAWRTPHVAVSIALWSSIALGLGLAIAAPTFLPLAELIGLSSSYKLGPAGPAVWRLSLAQSHNTLPVVLFAPDFNRAVPAGLGVLGLALAVTGVTARGLDAALVAVGLLGMVLALATPPSLAWIGRSPGFEHLLPMYAWPLLFLTLSQAVGDGTRALLSARGRRLLVTSFILTLGAAAVALYPKLALFRNNPGAFVVPYALAWAALGAVLLLRGTRYAHMATAVTVVLTVGELSLRVLPFATLQPPSSVLVSPPSAAVQFLRSTLEARNARFLGFPQKVGYPVTLVLFELPDFRLFSGAPLSRYDDYLKAIGPRIPTTGVHTLPVARSPLLDLAAVRYVGVEANPRRPQHYLDDDPDMPLVYADKWVRIYENRAALPRARIVHDFVAVADQPAAFEALRAVGAATSHVTERDVTRVVLERDPDGHLPPPLKGGSSPQERVRIVDASDPDCLVLEVVLDSPGLVVVADAYYPGWKAWVDDDPVSIFPADLLFRAVYVPAGSHTIVFRYEPISLRVGIGVALLASVTCTLFVLVPKRA